MKDNEKKVLRSLLANKDFRDWVQNPTDNRNLYWQKWLEARPEYSGVVQEARMQVDRLRFKEERLSEERLGQILQHIVSDKASERHLPAADKKKQPWGGILMAAAATVLLLVTCYVLLAPSWETHARKLDVVTMKHIQNPLGQKSVIRLPDGSMVSLNAGSALVFPSRFEGKERQVELKGEAFFEIEPNAHLPFLVKTGEVVTEALGTAFNVRAFAEEHIDISLVTGSVKVSGMKTKDGMEAETHMLLPGEKLRYDPADGHIKKTRFDPVKETGWRDGILVFSNTRFEEFVAQIERWYGVEVLVTQAPSRRWSVNGHFKNESLEEVLIGVNFTHGIQFKIDGNRVEISCE